MKTAAIPRILTALISCTLTISSLHAGDSLSKAVTTADPTGTQADLTLSGVFSEGWDEPWSKIQRGEGTPDMSLLRVQTNFLVQLFRLDTTLDTGLSSPEFSRSESITGTVEYALTRRFMPGIFFVHQWLEGRSGRNEDGSAGGAFARLQLIETRQSSLAFVAKATLPNPEVGVHATTCSYALAGWEDLSPLGLGRTGIYYHAQHEMLAGPLAPGGARNDTTYDISLARTWSAPDAILENFTTFVEAYGKTLLDGDHPGRSTVSLTPGFRFTLAGRHILMFGVDIPVAGPRTDEQLFRLTWIANF